MGVECPICGVIVADSMFSRHKGSRKCLVLSAMHEARGKTMSEINALLRAKGDFWLEYWRTFYEQNNLWGMLASEAGF